MFDEHEIRTFVYGTTRYFEVAAQQPATVGSPYLVTQGRRRPPSTPGSST
jgi:hypothetical protein